MNREQQELERAKQITVELLKDRGYPLEAIHVDEDNVMADDPELGRILAVYVSETKLSVGTLKDVVSICEDERTDLLLVYKDSITASAKKTLESIYSINVEVFSMADRQYNPTKHELSSRHEKATPEEAADVKKRFGSGLPGLLRTDKMVRWYNFKPGTIVRVTRPGGHVIYRIVK